MSSVKYAALKYSFLVFKIQFLATAFCHAQHSFSDIWYKKSDVEDPLLCCMETCPPQKKKKIAIKM